MKTTTLQVNKLRGIEERWSPGAGTAARIRDMTWDYHDGWKDAGGSIEIATLQKPDSRNREENYYKASARGARSNPWEGQGEIYSIHWFCQHNGARQWLLFEDESGTLNFFNGSKVERSSSADPWTPLVDLDGSVVTGRQIITTPHQRTQSQTWGGNIYFANGYDRVIVFNGTRVENSGFGTSPAPPTASGIVGMGSDGLHASMFFANGKYNVSKVFHDLVGCGVGSQNSDPDTVANTTFGIKNAETQGLDSGKRKNGYRYKVTFVNERGQESKPSISSGLCTFDNGNNLYSYEEGANDDYSLSNEDGRTFIRVSIPTGPKGTVARRVYRTQNLVNSSNELASVSRGDNFYFLEEIQDNFTTVFEDGRPDAFLGNRLYDEDFGPVPSGVKYLASFKNTMFVAGHSGSEVAYSAPLFPEVFPPDNVFFIGDANEGPITGMYATRNALVVFKQKGIYLIKGDPANGFASVTLTLDTGCSSPNSIKEIPGLGLAFLSQDGVYLLKGALENTGTITGIVNISTPIPDLMKKINPAALLNAFGEIYHTDREYWLAVPTIGSDKNDLVLCYHYEIGAWSFRENYPIGCMVETKDHRNYLFYGSNASGNESETNLGTTAQGIYVYSRGAKIKGHWYGQRSGGYANSSIRKVEPLYETSSIDFGSVYQSVQPAHVIVYAVAYGNNDLELNYRINRSTRQVRSTAQSADQQDPNDRQFIYGPMNDVERKYTFPPSIPAVWGPTHPDAGVWANARPVPVRFDISTASVGPAREMQFTFSPASRQIQIVGYDIEVKLGEQRNIKPLNEALGISAKSPRGGT